VAVIVLFLCPFEGRAQDNAPAKPPAEKKTESVEASAAPVEKKPETAEAPATPDGKKPEAVKSPSAPKLTEVYRSQFDKVLHVDRWRLGKVGKAPNGRRFLGAYGRSTPVTLDVADLPEHRFIRFRADLLILKSWDGVSKGSMPDTWGIADANGSLLLMTSFCNPHVHVKPDGTKVPPPAKRFQSYPDEFPHARHAPATGSSGEGKVLGFKFRKDTETTDTIYKIDMTFPHTDKELALRFFARLSHEADDEGWGLDNVIVETIDRETAPDAKQLEALWGKISGRDPVAANAALWEVVASGKKGCEFISKRWREFGEDEKKADPKVIALRAKVEKILVGLKDEGFRVRQGAQNELSKLGVDALDLLIELEGKDKDPEVSRTLKVVIAKLSKLRVAEEKDPHTAIVRSRVRRIVRMLETHESGYRISSSPVKKPVTGFDTLGSAIDGYTPSASYFGGSPRYTWFPHKGTSEWLQYDFSKPKTISEAKVYWFAESKTNSAPKSWEIQYKDAGGKWIPVKHEGEYGVARDKVNIVKFKPVTTGAVRLAVQLTENRSSGVHEFRVSNPEAEE